MTLRTLIGASLLAALLSLGVACGGGDDDDDGDSGGLGGPGSTNAEISSTPGKTAAAVAPGGNTSGSGSCEVNLSGDETASYTGKGGSLALGSDYWYSDDQMKKLVAELKDDNESVEDAMKKDPRIYVLILNCTSDKGSLSLIPSDASQYKDIPFKAGEYTIPLQGLLGGAEKPGEFSVLFSLGQDSYKVAEPGKLKITRWDEKGIAGTFDFKGQDAFNNTNPKKVNVSGKFDFACVAGDKCKR